MYGKSLISALLITASTISAGMQVGQQVANSISIHGRNGTEVYATYPLIEGSWAVEYIGPRANHSSSNFFRYIRLMQFEDDKVKSASEYSIKVDGPTTRWSDEPCKVESALYKNNYGTRLWKQKCLVIESVTFLQNHNEANQVNLTSLANRGIRNDSNSIKITYTRYGDFDKFMRVSYHFFPSVYGLENPTIGTMNTSPWNSANFVSDPTKVQFISALTRYAEVLVKHLDMAYESGSSGAPIPQFIYSESTKKITNPENEATNESPSKEERLKNLKAIFEKGLITKDIYEAQQIKILSTR